MSYGELDITDNTTNIISSNIPSYLPEKLRKWMCRFEFNHGRPIRIIHIGNIANNAYQNASLMRQAGIECDVLCFDYYHIMACPEWEEADYKGGIRNQFYPNWNKVSLGHYKRPKWFVQGPLKLCVRYLTARQSGDEHLTNKYWKLLSYSNRTEPIESKDWPRMAMYTVLFGLTRWYNALTDPARVSRKLRDIEGHIRGQYSRVWKTVEIIWPLFKQGLIYLSWALMKLRIIIEKKSCDQEYKNITSNLIKSFKEAFPNRNDQLISDDLIRYKTTLWPLRKIFSFYDLVIGYGIDPIYPMVADVPYFAMEHGTLRDIPYEADSMGRLTALAYHKAKGVFVTNSDCLNSARNLANNRAIMIPHPYDECLTSSRVEKGETLRLREELLQNLDANILLFHPTRQDWKQGTGYADKGNDLFFRAFSKLRKSGIKVGIICCMWGRNVSQSRELIESLECSSYVAWYEPMASIAFERMITACDVVVDQFVLGAFGGVLYRALTLGKPVCTYLDESNVSSCYGSIPPVLNCTNEEEIVKSLMNAVNTPGILNTIGNQGKDWMSDHHSGKQTIITQLELIKSSIENEYKKIE